MARKNTNSLYPFGVHIIPTGTLANSESYYTNQAEWISRNTDFVYLNYPQNVVGNSLIFTRPDLLVASTSGYSANDASSWIDTDLISNRIQNFTVPFVPEDTTKFVLLEWGGFDFNWAKWTGIDTSDVSTTNLNRWRRLWVDDTTWDGYTSGQQRESYETLVIPRFYELVEYIINEMDRQIKIKAPNCRFSIEGIPENLFDDYYTTNAYGYSFASSADKYDYRKANRAYQTRYNSNYESVLSVLDYYVMDISYSRLFFQSGRGFLGSTLVNPDKERYSLDTLRSYLNTNINEFKTFIGSNINTKPIYLMCRDTTYETPSAFDYPNDFISPFGVFISTGAHSDVSGQSMGNSGIQITEMIGRAYDQTFDGLIWKHVGSAANQSNVAWSFSSSAEYFHDEYTDRMQAVLQARSVSLDMTFQPQNVAFDTSTPGTIRLSWSKVKTLNRYAIYRATGGISQNYTKIATVDNSQIYFDKDIDSNVGTDAFFYKIAAEDTAGTVYPFSETITVPAGSARIETGPAERLTGGRNTGLSCGPESTQNEFGLAGKRDKSDNTPNFF